MTQIPVSMDVQEFVRASIVGVMSGIKKAQEEYANENSAYASLVCPAWAPPLSDIAGGTKGHADKIHELEFDLAVTIVSTSSLNSIGKVVVEVVGIGSSTLGYEDTEGVEQSRISRIKFKVPVRYPLAKLTRPDWNV